MTLTYAMTSGDSRQTASRPERRLRVAVVYPFFAHYREPVLRELIEHGNHDYYLLADTTDRSAGIPTIDLTNQRRFIKTRTWQLPAGTMWQCGLIGAVLHGQYDCYIFLGNAAWPATWLAALAARISRRRVLFWTHGWIRRDRPPTSWIRSCFYRVADALLLYGHTARAIALEKGFRADSLHVIYNSLNMEQQQLLRNRITPAQARAMRSQLFGDADTPVVIATARLTSAKRFDLLIHAARILKDRGIRIHVLIVGDGPQRASLERLTRESGVTVAFTGACYDEETLAIMFSCANVTVSPGNVGLTCMHSLGYGVPVITHDDPSDQMPEWEAITPGVTGDFFAKNSPESLAEIIARWLERSSDTDSQRELCVQVIREHYHPAVQRRLIDAAVSGVPASARVHGNGAERVSAASQRTQRLAVPVSEATE